ncbi:MAG: Wzz/FepE/Etk N-terminal domain-containing protein [Acidobacteriota bacterium]|nr:Wzz/FepE/Etk N-terminal domain-containing protein [Acidobacteriota bacterium]
MKDQELLNIADFFVILFRGKKTFILTFLFIMVLAVIYLAFAKRSYKLTGTLYVARIQGVLVEEGEFVAAKLRDYSFMKRALDSAGIELDIPVNRLQRLVSTEVLNEVKKIRDVGLVQLSVEYDDRDLAHAIFQALTSQLITDHEELVQHARKNFRGMIDSFWEDEAAVRRSLDLDETQIEATIEDGTPKEFMPAWVLLSHTVAEKRSYHQTLVKDIYYLELEASSASKTFNTRLAAEPKIPDEHFKPKRSLVVILGGILALLTATMATLGLHYYNEEIKPKLAS